MAAQTTVKASGAFSGTVVTDIDNNFKNINAELAIINPSGGSINIPTGSTLTVVDSGAAVLTNPKITTGIFDANGNVSLALSATATAVNGLGVTNAATGNGTTNPVTLAPSGTDAAVALTITPKGATGVLTLGLATGSADIVLGSSSVAQSVKIGNGAGAPTVNIANVSTAGATVSVAGAATADTLTDTVNIATGNTAGSGAKTVHIADGTPAGTGIHLVTIGTLTNASITTIRGGTGAGAIALAVGTTGTIVIGAAGQTGDIVLGSSSGTETVKISNGAGIANTNIAMVTVAGSTTAIAGAATGAGLTDTVNIALGNAAATGFKKVNIATGTPGTSGNNWVIIGGGTTTGITVNALPITYQAWNQATTVTGNGTTTLTFNLVDSAGNNVTLAAGLRVVMKLTTALSAGGITVTMNGGAGKSLKSHFNVANNIATAYASTGVLDMFYDGTQWTDMSE